MNGDSPTSSGNAALAALYQEIIFSHTRKPRNHGLLADAHARVDMNNPSCGDEITLTMRMDGDRIGEVGFGGEGCAISQASASMMTVLLQGRTLAEAAALGAAVRDLVHGRADAALQRELGEIRALAGVARYPARVRCALLAWNALEEASRALTAAPPPSDPAPPS